MPPKAATKSSAADDATITVSYKDYMESQNEVSVSAVASSRYLRTGREQLRVASLCACAVLERRI